MGLRENFESEETAEVEEEADLLQTRYLRVIYFNKTSTGCFLKFQLALKSRL
jgi:hypothetical protein